VLLGVTDFSLKFDSGFLLTSYIIKKTVMKKLTKLFVWVIFVFSVAGCSNVPKQIRIGIYGPFTGGSAQMGNSMRNGVRLAVDEINATGGILGKPIVLIERDDEASPDKAIPIVQDLLDNQRIVALLGPVNTGVANVTTPLTNAKKIPHIINVSTGAKVNELFAQSPDNYVFRLSAGDDIQSEMVVREAVTNRQYTKPALLCDVTPYGQNAQVKIEAALARRGIKPVYVGSFKIKDTVMTEQVKAARAAGADVMMAYGIGPEMAAVSNSIKKENWRVDIIGSWTLSMSSYITTAGDNGNGAIMPQTFIELGAKTPKQKKFIADYEAKFNEKPIAVASAAAQGYDSMYFLKAAIEQSGSVDGAKVKAALENLQKPYEGITGSYTTPYSPTDHEAIKEANMKMGVVVDRMVIPVAR
jgi:branched-chain amino acid transport system substrate-binding protein